MINTKLPTNQPKKTKTNTNRETNFPAKRKRIGHKKIKTKQKIIIKKRREQRDRECFVRFDVFLSENTIVNCQLNTYVGIGID